MSISTLTNIKRFLWLKSFKGLICFIAIISLLCASVSADVAGDIGGEIVDAAIQKPLVFSWMQSEDHVSGSTSITAVMSGVPSISDFTLVDNPYPNILDQNSKAWKAELNFSNYDGYVLDLSTFSISTEFYLPIDTSFGDATYLTFGVYGMLECTSHVSSIDTDDIHVSIGDKAFEPSTYRIIDGNKFIALFSINGANIQQSMSQQKVQFNITFGEWYPYDPLYGEKPNFYLQFGDITQTISMTANQAYLDNIFGLLQGSSSNNQAGSDFNNSMQDDAENMNGLIEDINGLYKPNVNDLNPQNDLLNYFGGGTTFLTEFMEFLSASALPIGSMLIIVVSASFISFVLFGKK